MKIFHVFGMLALILLFGACVQDADENDTASGTADTGVYLESATGFKVIRGPESVALDGEGFRDIRYTDGQLSFVFRGFDLGIVTPGSDGRPQHALGQHIQPFITSIPGTPKNTPTFGIRLPNTHVMVGGVLVQSDHFSVKDRRAGAMRRISVSDGTGTDVVTISDPVVLLNHPKGNYRGQAAENIPLDFFLLNYELGDNRKVEFTLNGETTLLNTWQNYYITGLEPGTHRVSVKLVDAAGNLITPAALAFVERDFTVE